MYCHASCLPNILEESALFQEPPQALKLIGDSSSEITHNSTASAPELDGIKFDHWAGYTARDDLEKVFHRLNSFVNERMKGHFSEAE